MNIGGLQKFSLLDYPGLISAVVFTQGCNFRCHFCYNPMLVWPAGLASANHAGRPKEEGKFKNIVSSQDEEIKEGNPRITEDALFDFLKTRIGKLDAIVITGGEPTIQPDLPQFIGKLKNLGFKIKLDTNGTNPEAIRSLISQNLVDYLAMDVKASPEKYAETAGAKIDLNKIEKSIKIIIESGLPYEFRTTVVPGLHKEEDIGLIGAMIKGAGNWFLQQFKSDADLVNEKFKGKKAFTDKEMERLKKIAEKYVKFCLIR